MSTFHVVGYHATESDIVNVSSIPPHPYRLTSDAACRLNSPSRYAQTLHTG